MSLFDKNAEYSKRSDCIKSDRFRVFNSFVMKSAEKCRNRVIIDKSLIMRQFHLDLNTLQKAKSFKTDHFLTHFDTFLTILTSPILTISKISIIL